MVLSITENTLIQEFFVSGFTHILPHGGDHVLFILGLFFLSRNLGVLLFQMTLFTVAHSITLGLSLYGYLSLPTAFIEIVIALSISFVAIENLLVRDRMKCWRPWIVFVFGLVHGLGFAHCFTQLPVISEFTLLEMISFNFGIECGQLAVIALAYAAVALWWKRDGYTKWVARPACMLIAMTGFVLAVERGFF